MNNLQRNQIGCPEKRVKAVQIRRLKSHVYRMVLEQVNANHQSTIPWLTHVYWAHCTNCKLIHSLRLNCGLSWYPLGNPTMQYRRFDGHRRKVGAEGAGGGWWQEIKSTNKSITNTITNCSPSLSTQQSIIPFYLNLNSVTAEIGNSDTSLSEQ
jgi:hypothetical protein